MQFADKYSMMVVKGKVMKRNKKTITMKIEVGKPSVGHQANTHQVHDNRPRRERTRSAKNSRAIREFY